MFVNLPLEADHDLLSAPRFLADDRFYADADIHSGDRLFALGFPFGCEADNAGFPILRNGAIASYPLTPTKVRNTFLLDLEVFRGNSGGPVYFYERNRLIKENWPKTFDLCQIMGLISEEKILTERVQTLYETKDEMHPINVAVVVHASLIRETIEMLPPSGISDVQQPVRGDAATRAP